MERHSTLHVTVKVLVQHDSAVDPCDVISECDYSFSANVNNGDSGTITDTEIIEVEYVSTEASKE